MTLKKVHTVSVVSSCKAWLLLVCSALMLTWTGCKDPEACFASISDPRLSGHWERLPQDSMVETDFGFFCSSARHRPATKMTVATTQTNNSFRGLQDIQLIPFLKQGVITASDHPTVLGQYSGLTIYNESSLNSRFCYYNNARFATGVASFLLYARARVSTQASDIETKLYNGSLVANYPEDFAPSGIRFWPEKIYDSDEVPAGATALADYLTHIASARGVLNEGTDSEVIQYWQNADHSYLRAYYQNFIKQDNTGSLLMAGASANVMALVNELYSKLSSLSLVVGSMDEAVRDDILSRISTYTGITFDAGEHKVTSLGEMDNYPASIGLPDGAAALRWNSLTSKFEPQMETTTVSPINAAGRFAYPAELWYRANSRIKTSDTREKQAIYAPQSAWSGVLAEYEYNNAMVNVTTRSIALITPAQYAVGCLQVKLKGTTATLQDALERNVSIGTGLFPLTGIVVGSQRPVDFEFKPIGVSEADDRFAYDCNVKRDESNYFCLSTTDAAATTQTLVLQTRDAEAVKVVLEFQNNSASDFKGVNGTVYRGTKFYLVGVLTPPADPSEDYERRVFTQDYVTTANMTVGSLAAAYNVMPDLLSPKLEIGVAVTTQWEQATTTTVPIVY